MNTTPTRLRQLINEEITRSDKAEIKKLIAKEIEKQLKSRQTKKLIEDELIKLIGKNKVKQDIGDITKKILKQLYRNMSLHHSFIIDKLKA
jgi:uncharacterized membrane protein YheB (UPF0754 family)